LRELSSYDPPYGRPKRPHCISGALEELGRCTVQRKVSPTTAKQASNTSFPSANLTAPPSEEICQQYCGDPFHATHLCRAGRERAPHDLRSDQGCVSRCESARRHLGYAKQAETNRNDADAFAESLRPIVAPFIHLSSRRIAKVLNDRAASHRQPARRGNLSPCCAWWNA
jgi:hypothetical protein